MAHVGRGVDASVAAAGATVRTAAGPAGARQPGRAGAATAAAVGLVAGQIDAGGPAGGEPLVAADAAAGTGAQLASRTGGPTSPAVHAFRLGVHTGAGAFDLADGAVAAAALAGAPGRAAPPAGAAVRLVDGQIHADRGSGRFLDATTGQWSGASRILGSCPGGGVRRRALGGHRSAGGVGARSGQTGLDRPWSRRRRRRATEGERRWSGQISYADSLGQQGKAATAART